MINLNSYIIEKLKIDKNTEVIPFSKKFASALLPYKINEYDEFEKNIIDWCEAYNIESYEKLTINSKETKEQVVFLNEVIKDEELLKQISYYSAFLNKDIARLERSEYKCFSTKRVTLYMDNNSLLYEYGLEDKKFYLIIRYTDYGTLG